jgi:hypothetical protein
MPINPLASQYLEVFKNNGEFEGGLSFAAGLRAAKLDFSLASLDRVDTLLDQVRTRFKPDPDTFLSVHANQNFLYLLCFYVGHCVAVNSKQQVVWLQYSEFIEAFPEHQAMYPECFATSVTCLLEKTGFFIPLSAIQERLFDDPPGKSVAFSASAFLTEHS